MVLNHKLMLPIITGACMIGGCASGPQAHGQGAGNKAHAPPVIVSPEQASAATAEAVKQVIATEQGFAKTMATRDFKTFITFLSPDAIFFSGNSVKHGSAEVATQWQPYFEGRKAPFSWAPDHVEVLASGKLALSTGPVYEDGKVVARFNSIWRLEADNTWRIVFDKGEAVCGIRP
jgi:ketosteroid isomerase-like protein